MHHANSQSFLEISVRLGVPSDQAQAIWEQLRIRYFEPHRAYHNLVHIDSLLCWLDKLSINNDAIELAIWFHDCIYEPQATDNEVASARYFAESFGPFLESRLTCDVERLILATDSKAARSENADEKWIRDIDLSVLGSEPEIYEIYRIAIRREYAFVPDADFRLGRKAILQSFLATSIYTTDDFRSFEQQARSNLKHEISRLKSREI
jgi:predicted metal-dependent HD superfamily phosphohydrolase